MKGKMANFTQLESYSIKRILKAILKIDVISKSFLQGQRL